MNTNSCAEDEKKQCVVLSYLSMFLTDKFSKVEKCVFF